MTKKVTWGEAYTALFLYSLILFGIWLVTFGGACDTEKSNVCQRTVYEVGPCIPRSLGKPGKCLIRADDGNIYEMQQPVKKGDAWKVSCDED